MIRSTQEGDEASQDIEVVDLQMFLCTADKPELSRTDSSIVTPFDLKCNIVPGHLRKINVGIKPVRVNLSVKAVSQVLNVFQNFGKQYSTASRDIMIADDTHQDSSTVVGETPLNDSIVVALDDMILMVSDNAQDQEQAVFDICTSKVDLELRRTPERLSFNLSFALVGKHHDSLDVPIWRTFVEPFHITTTFIQQSKTKEFDEGSSINIVSTELLQSSIYKSLLIDARSVAASWTSFATDYFGSDPNGANEDVVDVVAESQSGIFEVDAKFEGLEILLLRKSKKELEPILKVFLM